ncbi:MAG TPA: M1 family aminopeptidase [Cyclobacteriaceae bacterium]|nr:M1 family aminopeptidase [Cyclobacteriaceae bacterium]
MWIFISYELKYWVKTPMLWIFFIIVSLLVFGAVSSDQITIGGGVGSVYKNAPSVIQAYYALMSLICLLMTTAFMNASANRDFSSGMHQFVFTSPIKRKNYFFGKFIGAFIIAVIPLLGVSFGALIGPLMPWVQPERYGDVIWSGHLQGVLSFAIPNTIIAGALLYSLAVVFRSNIVSFVGAMLILVFYVVSQGFTSDIEKEWLANMLDPFGFASLNTLTKYKTIDEKNLTAAALEGHFLLNRLVWVGMAVLLLLLMYTRFSFTTKERVSKKKKTIVENESADLSSLDLDVKRFHVDHSKRFSWSALWHMITFETKSIIKNQVFIILVIIGLINLIASLTSFTGNYGASKYPVTYDVIDYIRGSFYLFLIGLITFYTGVLVWKERDAKINEIQDATPARMGMLFSSKLVAMLFSVALVLLSTMLVGVIAQTAYGYTRYDFGVYIKSLLVLDMFKFGYMIVIALLFHYLINNRYLAYFVFVAFVIVNEFIWSLLEVNSKMLDFGGTPSVTYSDMNGFGPFVSGQIWFNAYWTIFCIIICFIAYAFVLRGTESAFGIRFKLATNILRKRLPVITLLGALFVLCAGFVYYNTKIINTFSSSKEVERTLKDYELAYKQYEHMPQPRWVNLDYHIDIFPYDRDLYVTINAVAVNKSNQPISELHFNIPSAYNPLVNRDTMLIEIPNASLKLDDQRLYYRIYELASPLAPGDSLLVKTRLVKITQGFENQVSFTELTQNGSFFNNYNILPTFGYDRRRELSDKNKRQKMGLPKRQRLPFLNEEDSVSRANNYIAKDSDWVSVTTTISTADDQIAVAPGSLVKEWRDGNRRFFEYHLDKNSLNFYSFISARFEVAREKWNDIDLEVYYIKEHAYNVPNMLNSMRKSLDYYTENFGPYYHKQCRIIEFPRYASFAQAFPGTMPYGEGIGFITDLRNVTEDDIDVVFYIVAHEMGHQYWAHQLIGASMRGSEMMSESFAQYSALMVMEKEYGRNKMNKFLKYEMNGYLAGRSNEFEAERPLKETENQGYIHYHKGSIVLYYLKEMIGENAFNKALASLINKYAYQDPLYPTSYASISAFREQTPDSLQYLIDDLLENITLFTNRVLETDYVKTGDEYEVTIKTYSEKFRADSLGRQTEVPLNDFIDIGIFAETKNKKLLGEPLYYKRLKITEKENVFTIRVKDKPYQAGIDPYNYLIDRLPEDNVKRVIEK